MAKSTFLLVLGGFLLDRTAAAALGHHHVHAERAACNQDNLYRCFIDTRYTQSASDFCSGLSAATVTVTTPLTTVTATEWTKGAVNIVTALVTATTTVITETIPSATYTVTAGAGSVLKRDSPAGPANPPYCMTAGTTYPASRITSACSCINVPATTFSVTVASSTKTVTTTMTSNAVSTTSATVWNTISTNKIEGIYTVTVESSSQAVARAPAEDDPPLNLLFNSGFETSGMKYWSLTPSSGWTSSVSSLTVARKQTTRICSIKGNVGASLATLKSTHLVDLKEGWKYRVGFSAIGANAVTEKIPWAAIGYISMNNPLAGVNTKLQLDSGTPVGSLRWNIYESTITVTKENAGFNEFSLVFLKTGFTINFDDFYVERVQ